MASILMDRAISKNGELNSAGRIVENGIRYNSFYDTDSTKYELVLKHRKKRK